MHQESGVTYCLAFASPLPFRGPHPALPPALPPPPALPLPSRCPLTLPSPRLHPAFTPPSLSSALPSPCRSHAGSGLECTHSAHLSSGTAPFCSLHPSHEPVSSQASCASDRLDLVCKPMRLDLTCQPTKLHSSHSFIAAGGGHAGPCCVPHAGCLPRSGGHPHPGL